MRLSILTTGAVLVLALGCVGSATAQTPPAPAAATPAAQPADVASPEAIVAALYDVISGDAGVERDWDRFRSLFHPHARLIPTGKRADGTAGARVVTPEEYIALSAPAMETLAIIGCKSLCLMRRSLGGAKTSARTSRAITRGSRSAT